MSSYSFTSDERGLEPHGDLLALPLVAGGFTIFIFLLFSVSQGWEERVCSDARSGDVQEISQLLRRAILPRSDSNSVLISASGLEDAVNNNDYLRDICPGCGGISVRIISISSSWTIGDAQRGNTYCSYIPATVEFDIARREPAVIKTFIFDCSIGTLPLDDGIITPNCPKGVHSPRT